METGSEVEEKMAKETEEAPAGKPGPFQAPASVALKSLCSCSGMSTALGSTSFSDKWDYHRVCSLSLRASVSPHLNGRQLCLSLPNPCRFCFLIGWLLRAGVECGISF